MIDIRTLEAFVSVTVPGTELPVEGRLESCIFDGVTLKLDPGPHVQALHRLITSGQAIALAIILKEPEES